MNQKSLDKKKPECGGKYCVYKNFGGNCIFCGKKDTMKQKPKQLDWEKEFDNDCWDTKDGVMTVTYLMKGGNKVGKLTERVTKEMIKSYVKIRLTQQRTEILEEVLNLECLKEDKFRSVNQGLGCQNARQEIENQLRKEIKEEINKL